MGTVDIYTKAEMNEIRDSTLVDADIVGDDLVFTTFGGLPINAGNVRGPTGTSTIPTIWGPNNAYVVNNLVMYAGRLWKSIQAGTNKPPALFSSYWTPMTGYNPEAFFTRDPYFEGDSPVQNWETFWYTGASQPVVSATTTAGEFETGRQAMKIALAANTAQRFYDRDEQTVKGGEAVVAEVRAKLTGASAGATILQAQLMQNDTTAGPSPLAAGLVVTAATEGNQTLTTAWQTFRFSMVCANGKPRAQVNFIVNAPAGNAVNVVIDSIVFYKRKSILLVDTDWIPLPLAVGSFYGGNFPPPQYRRYQGFVVVEGLIGGLAGGLASGSLVATLPQYFRPAYRLINSIVDNQAWGRVDVSPDGKITADSPVPVNGFLSIDLKPFVAEL